MLDDLQNLIIYDFKSCSTVNVHSALREFGIKTKIPHCVIKNAIICSQLYSIDFLQNILDYIANEVNPNLRKHLYV